MHQHKSTYYNTHKCYISQDRMCKKLLFNDFSPFSNMILYIHHTIYRRHNQKSLQRTTVLGIIVMVSSFCEEFAGITMSKTLNDRLILFAIFGWNFSDFFRLILMVVVTHPVNIIIISILQSARLSLRRS